MGVKQFAREQWAGMAGVFPILLAVTFFLSASMGLHELGSRFLGAEYFWKDILSYRFPSCLAHSVGITIGFAFCVAYNGPIRAGASRPLPWIAVAVAEAISVAGVYASLANPLDYVALLAAAQVLCGFAAVLGLMLAAPFVCLLDHRQILIATGLAYIATNFIVWGVLSFLEAVAPLRLVALACIALALAGGAAVFAFFRSSPVVQGEVRGATFHALSLDGSLTVRGLKCVHPVALIWIVVASYGFVFGILHAIPLGLTTYEARNAAKIVGALLAAALLYASFAQAKIDTTVIWNRTYRFVFPLTVLAALLLPFTQDGGFFLALVCSEWAGFYFDMVLFIACCVIGKALRVNTVQFFAHVFFARSLGYLIGDISSVIAYSVMLMKVVNVIEVIVFVLLTIVTFNFNAEKYAKTAWGILPKEEPQGHFNRELLERCRVIAAQYRLTGREQDVLLLLAKGKRPKEIGKELVVSIATVRTHIQGIYNKLDVHSHDALMKLFEQVG